MMREKTGKQGAKMKKSHSLYKKFTAIEHERWSDWQLVSAEAVTS